MPDARDSIVVVGNLTPKKSNQNRRSTEEEETRTQNLPTPPCDRQLAAESRLSLVLDTSAAIEGRGGNEEGNGFSSVIPYQHAFR
jgi:hypothetical protein